MKHWEDRPNYNQPLVTLKSGLSNVVANSMAFSTTSVRDFMVVVDPRLPRTFACMHIAHAYICTRGSSRDYCMLLCRHKPNLTIFFYDNIMDMTLGSMTITEFLSTVSNSKWVLVLGY